MAEDSKESNIIIDRLDGFGSETHTCMASMPVTSISSMAAQKPIQVVPPTPVVRHAASPATIMDTGQSQHQHQPQQSPQLQNSVAATPSSVSFSVANMGGNAAPLLQQNVNIMNINLPTAVTAGAASASSIATAMPAPTTSMTTNAGSTTTAATLIQLPDGRLLLQQAAPNMTPTIAFVSVPANANQSGQVSLGQHPSMPAGQPSMQSFAFTVPTTLTQSAPTTLTAYGQPQVSSAQVQIQHQTPQIQPPPQQSTVQVVGMSPSHNPQPQQQHQQPQQQQQYQLQQQAQSTTQIVVSSASNGTSNALQRRPQIKPASSAPTTSQTNLARGGKPSNVSHSLQISSSSTVLTTTASNANSTLTKSSTSKAAPGNNFTMQLPTNMAPEDLRRKIESQINRLRSLAQPSAKDQLMLQRLQEFLEQLPATSSAVSSTRPEEEGDSQSSSFTETGSPSARTASPNPSGSSSGPSRALLPRPKPSTLMREVNCLLGETRELMERPPSHEETLLVEFRIVGQRYMLRLSRTQKAELESVLAKATPEQQQKILSLVREKHVALSSNNGQTATLQNTVGCLRSATIIASPCQHQHQTHIQLQPQPQVQTLQQQPQQQPTLTVNRPRRGIAAASTSNLTTFAASRKIVTTTTQLPQQQTGSSANVASTSNRVQGRTQQQMVLTPQMRRSLQIRRQLQTEQQKAACPATGEPFRLVKEAAIALMKYHVYQDTDNSDHAVNEADSIINDACRLLGDRQRHILAAVRRLERRCVSRNGAAPIAPEEGGPNAEEAFVITDMALDLERDTLEAERLQFQTRPRSFQPLEFDLRTGKATHVPLAPPPPEEEEEEEEEEELAIKEEDMEEEVAEEEEVEEEQVDVEESVAVKEDVWESILDPGRNDRARPDEGPSTAKRLCVQGAVPTEESETDRAVAAIMGDTSASSWSAGRSDKLIHSEDPDVDAAIRSIM